MKQVGSENLMSDILQEDPFSLEFDSKKFARLLENKKITKEEKIKIEFYLFCNKLFISSLKKIYLVFKTSNLDQNKMFDFIYRGLNNQFIQANNSYIDSLKGYKNKGIGIDTDGLLFQTLKTPLGNTLPIKQLLERSGDVLNILIPLVNTYYNENLETLNIDTSQAVKKSEFLEVLWGCSNQLYTFRSFYEILRYEKGDIIVDSKVHYFKLQDKYKRIRTYNTIGEIRENSNFFEISSYLKHPKEKKLGIISVKLNDTIVPRVGKINKNLIDKGLSRFISNGFLKSNEAIIDDITIAQFFEILGIILEISSLSHNASEKNNNILYKIERQILVETIHSCIEKNTESIEKIINLLIDKTDVPYFWRKPLFEFNGYIYISFSLLHAPNTNMILETILKENLTKSELLNEFRKEVKEEIIEVRNEMGYHFKHINLKEKYPKDLMVVELKDYYIFFKFEIILPLPIESEEINSALKILDASAEKVVIDSKKYFEELEHKKPVIPLILCNKNCFTGLFFNNVPVFDLKLLQNYFITGSFGKGQLINRGSKSITRRYNEIKYYKNEKEFNESFLDFIKYPIPIVHRYSKVFWNNMNVFPDEVQPQINIEILDFKDGKTTLEEELYQLYQSINYQYFNETKEREDELFNENIQFHLTNLFQSIAFGDYDTSLNRFKISDIFQKVQLNGLAHLNVYFRNSLADLSSLKVKSDREFKHIDYDGDEVFAILNRIFGDNNRIDFLDFTINENFEKILEKKLISFSIDIISVIGLKEFDNEDFRNFLIAIVILKNYRKKYQLDSTFQGACSNFISALNHNNRYQQARNFSEEILLLSIREKKHYQGWGTLFNCLDQQKNIYDATIYGCLYITSLSIEDKLSYSEYLNVFYSILKFTRNTHFYSLLDLIFDLLKNIRLKEYDSQKVHLSYFLSSFNRVPKSNEQLNIINESFCYFENSQNKIIKYEDKGVFPWLNYFYNIQRLINEKVFQKDLIHKTQDYINFLEEKLSIETLTALKELHFGGENLREKFVEKLKSVLMTYSYRDYIYEIQNLELMANNLLERGVSNSNYEDILLTGFVNNEIGLSYSETHIDSGVRGRFNLENEAYNYLDGYLKYVTENIDIKNYQTYLYLFSLKKKVYALSINCHKKIDVIYLGERKIELLNEWSKSINNFYFNPNNYFDLNEQEEEYNQLLKNLSFLDLNLTNLTSELLISTNLDLCHIPHNLLICNNDFLGSKVSISNVLSLEWFIKNGKDYKISSDYKVSSWIPIEDGDPDISYTFEKLKPVFEKKQVNLMTRSYPENLLNSEVNVFLAHGSLNNQGFKAIYRSDKINSGVVNKELVFGKGDIAILFICNSGKITEHFASHSVVSLIHEIISIGYKSVIAPNWSLNTSIPSFWLDEFFNIFDSGETIGNAVFKANIKLSEYKESISSAFFVPQGRLAMHLYGNPNISIYTPAKKSTI